MGANFCYLEAADGDSHLESPSPHHGTRDRKGLGLYLSSRYLVTGWSWIHSERLRVNSSESLGIAQKMPVDLSIPADFRSVVTFRLGAVHYGEVEYLLYPKKNAHSYCFIPPGHSTNGNNSMPRWGINKNPILTRKDVDQSHTLNGTNDIYNAYNE